MQVFISYRNLPEYIEWSERLKTWLEAHNYTVWLDRYSIKRGITPDSMVWRRSIAQGIKSSDVMLVVFGPECYDSDIMLDEWSLGKANNLHLFFLKVKEVPIKDRLPGYVEMQYHDMSRTGIWDVLATDLHKAASQPRPTSIDPFAPYIRDALDLFFSLIDHRTNDKSFTELDLRVQNRPQYVESSVEQPRRLSNPISSKLMLREGMQPPIAPVPSEIEIASVEDGMNKLDGRLLLLGEPGAGKTFTLYQYARKTLQARLTQPTAPLPIYLICSTWHDGQTLLDWIRSQWKSLKDISEADLAHTLLLLDGFDELGTNRVRKVVGEDRQEYEEIYDPRPLFLNILLSTGQILLSCRITEYEMFNSKVKLKGAVTLRPLDDKQIADYLADLPDLRDAIQGDAELTEMVRTPLLLSLFAFGYRDAPDDVRALRDLKAGALSEAIFKQYVERRYTHESYRFIERNETPPFTLDEVYLVLGHIAMINASNGQNVRDNVLTDSEFETAIDSAELDINRRSAFTDYTALLHLIVRIEHAHRFIHLRLRDHFVRAYCYPKLWDRKYYNSGANPALALATLPDAEAVESLIAALADAYKSVRKSAAEALGVIGDARAVGPLIIALKDIDSAVRGVAAVALGAIGDVQAVEPLIVVLMDADNNVRRSTARTLGRLGDVRAVEPLIAALKDVDDEVRWPVAEALAKIGTPAVVPLIATLKDADNKVRGSAAGALAKIGTPAVEPLITALKDADSEVRRLIAGALGRIGNYRAVEPLIAALKDVDSRVRGTVGEALGRLGDTRAVKPLIAMLNDVDNNVRRSVTEALGNLRDIQGVEPLIAMLKDIDNNVRRSAAEALGDLRDARAVEPLIISLKDADSIRRSATGALAKIGTPAVESLIVTLKDTDIKIHQSAAGALAKIGIPAVEPLIIALKHSDRKIRGSATRMLGNFWGALAVGPLIATLKDKDWNVRRIAAEALAKTGIPAVEALIAALKDKDWKARQSAAEVLAKIGIPAVEPLITALKDNDWKARQSVAEVLVKIGIPAVKPLIAVLNDADSKVCESVAEALVKIGTSAVKPLITALKNTDSEVGQYVAKALEKIGTPKALAAVAAWRKRNN